MLEPKEIRQLPDKDEETVRIKLFLRTIVAASHLGYLNSSENERINWAQQLMFLGFASIFEGIIGVMLAGTDSHSLIVILWILVGILTLGVRDWDR